MVVWFPDLSLLYGSLHLSLMWNHVGLVVVLLQRNGWSLASYPRKPVRWTYRRDMAKKCVEIGVKLKQQQQQQKTWLNTSSWSVFIIICYWDKNFNKWMVKILICRNKLINDFSILQNPKFPFRFLLKWCYNWHLKKMII